ncbi:MAG: (2Fe-2S)-binding protein [Pseudomonadota bacterium]|nr:(2Fe-2S)-binding protein [Pseudomonadota bacterium]
MFKRLDNSAQNRVNVTINGQPVQVPEGETVAAAVLAHGLAYTRTTPVSGAPRAPFCLMGVCFECLMVIDGKTNQRACMEQVRDGMRIECQQGTGKLRS